MFTLRAMAYPLESLLEKLKKLLDDSILPQNEKEKLLSETHLYSFDCVDKRKSVKGPPIALSLTTGLPFSSLNQSGPEPRTLSLLDKRILLE